MTKEQVVISTLKKASTSKLLDLWEETDRRIVDADVAKVRGWIMDALEAHNPEAFDAWMMDMSDTCDNPRKHFAA